MCALWIVMNFKTTVVGVARAKFPFFGKKLPSTTCAHCDMDILQTLCTYIHYSGPPLERPFILPEKSGLSKGVASQEGDISMHFWFCSRKEVASQEGVASHERGLSRGGPLYICKCVCVPVGLCILNDELWWFCGHYHILTFLLSLTSPLL
jgi:hypothetical protein